MGGSDIQEHSLSQTFFVYAKDVRGLDPKPRSLQMLMSEVSSLRARVFDLVFTALFRAEGRRCKEFQVNFHMGGCQN